MAPEKTTWGSRKVLNNTKESNSCHCDGAGRLLALVSGLRRFVVGSIHRPLQERNSQKKKRATRHSARRSRTRRSPSPISELVLFIDIISALIVSVNSLQRSALIIVSRNPPHQNKIFGRPPRKQPIVGLISRNKTEFYANSHRATRKRTDVHDVKSEKKKRAA